MFAQLSVNVVEDHDLLREATVSMLQENGFHAVGWESAEAIHSSLSSAQPALYIVDVNLPGESGLELARRLRLAQPVSGIVMVTARVEEIDRLLGLELGADDYLVKPFDELLHLPYFVGSEGHDIIEAGVFGAEKETWWLKPCLDYYTNRVFVKADGSYDTITLPNIMMKQIGLENAIKMDIAEHILMNDFRENKNEVLMFPPEFFCAKNHGTGVIEKTENTFTIHHFAMSWVPKHVAFLPNIKRKLIKILGPKPILWLIGTFKFREIRTFLNSKKSN